MEVGREFQSLPVPLALGAFQADCSRTQSTSMDCQFPFLRSLVNRLRSLPPPNPKGYSLNPNSYINNPKHPMRVNNFRLRSTAIQQIGKSASKNLRCPTPA